MINESNHHEALEYLEEYDDYCNNHKLTNEIYYSHCCYYMSICFLQLLDFNSSKKTIEKAISIYAKNHMTEELSEAKKILEKINNKLNKD